MAYHRVTVVGGSGFVGRQIVKRLADDGVDVRVAVRRPERASFLTEASGTGRITAVYADVWDEASVARVVDGTDAVINTVGHYVERGKATFEAIHWAWRNACRAGIGDGGSSAAHAHIGPRCRPDV